MSEAGRGRASGDGGRPATPQATMSLVAHLTELRNRVAKALLALLVATAVAFWWYDHGLGDFIRAPVLRPARPTCATAATSDGCGLLITDVFGGVFIRLKVAFLAGAVLSAPFWLYQLWAFITPGPQAQREALRDRLRRRLHPAVRRRARSWPTSRWPRACSCCCRWPATAWSSR